MKMIDLVLEKTAAVNNKRLIEVFKAAVLWELCYKTLVIWLDSFEGKVYLNPRRIHRFKHGTVFLGGF